MTNDGMSIKLGTHLSFATNRFPEPEVWAKIVGKTLGLRYVQFTADLLNPWLPWKVLNEEIKRINTSAKKYNVKVDTSFSSTFTRVNHLLHPSSEIRKVWFGYLKRHLFIAKELGARGAGCHFGIFSVADFENKKRRDFILKEGIESWQKLSEYGKKIGLEFLLFEPMSIPRECASTISEAKNLLGKVNKNASIPILLCLDVDHGDLESKNPDDTNPYIWIKELGSVSPVIHIKQSTKNKGGHWPFTPEYNRKGIIRPKKVISAIVESGAKDVVLCFEFSFRERYPTEYLVIDSLIKSTEYWRRFVKE